MATDSEILAALTGAAALDIDPAQMVALIDRSIAAGLTDDGRVVISVGADGATTSFSVDQAMRLREYYASLAGRSGGMIRQDFEFR